MTRLSWTEARRYVEKAGAELRYKDESRLMRLIGRVLRPLVPDFMSRYATTIRRTIYVPRSWRTISEDLLAHELQHVRDAVRFPILFEVSYLLLPLPVVFTARAFWEWRGYRINVERAAERGESLEETQEWIRSQFCGPAYAWMWPFPKAVDRWVADEYAKAKRPGIPKRGDQ